MRSLHVALNPAPPLDAGCRTAPFTGQYSGVWGHCPDARTGSPLKVGLCLGTVIKSEDSLYDVRNIGGQLRKHRC